MESERGPVLGITLGEAAGVGPEIVVKAAVTDRVRERCTPVLIGPVDVVRSALRSSGLPGTELRVADQIDALTGTGNALRVLDTGELTAGVWTHGVLSAAVGHSAAHDTAVAVGLATDRSIDAIVSGPVNKRALELGGQAYPGQTGYLEALTGTRDALTILVGGPMRVALLSSHVSMRAAIDMATREAVVLAATRLVRALRTSFGIDGPRIGVAALNPHASDSGLMGVEEEQRIIPAVRDLVRDGVDAVGPVPADAFFAQGAAGRYDGMLALYHDQGVVPLKRYHYATYAYGLPVIRTTVGHGTAYDIAGTGLADPATMVNAIELAVELCGVRQRHGELASHAG